LHNINPFFPGTKGRMRVYIGCDDTRNTCQLSRDKRRPGTDFQNTVTALNLSPCCIEQKVRIGFGLVDLGRIVRHELHSWDDKYSSFRSYEILPDTILLV
jgi:hypothetical protein